MDRLWKVLGLFALLVAVPTLGHADAYRDCGRGAEDSREMMVPIDGRGSDLMIGRGCEGRGSLVAIWNDQE